MSELSLTNKYYRSLSPSGLTPPDSPDWVKSIDNPYLHGAFTPICTEVEADDLEVVQGQIPTDLNGAYFRNGPNPVHEPRTRYHWFDGDGMVYGLWIKNGKARYRNRWIRTAKFKLEQEHQKAMVDPMNPFNSAPGFEEFVLTDKDGLATFTPKDGNYYLVVAHKKM